MQKNLSKLPDPKKSSSSKKVIISGKVFYVTDRNDSVSGNISGEETLALLKKGAEVYISEGLGEDNEQE